MPSYNYPDSLVYTIESGFRIGTAPNRGFAARCAAVAQPRRNLPDEVGLRPGLFLHNCNRSTHTRA